MSALSDFVGTKYVQDGDRIDITIPEPNVHLLEEIELFLRGKHKVGKIPKEQFDFSTYVSGEKGDLCNTQACAAGWAALKLPALKNKDIISYSINNTLLFNDDAFSSAVGLAFSNFREIFIEFKSIFDKEPQNINSITAKTVADRIKVFLAKYKKLAAVELRERKKELEAQKKKLTNTIATYQHELKAIDKEIASFNKKGQK